MNQTGLSTTRKPPVKGRRLFLLLLLILITLGFIVLLGSTLRAAREAANRVKCNKQMSAIGQSLLLYANEYQGAFPSALKDLIRTQDVTSQVFVCPSTNDTPAAAGRSFEERIANLDAGGHCSYIYLGAGRHWNSEPEKVLLYEPMFNHGDGFHIVLSDGHSEFLTGPNASTIQAELKSGKNPPPTYIAPKTRP